MSEISSPGRAVADSQSAISRMAEQIYMGTVYPYKRDAISPPQRTRRARSAPQRMDAAAPLERRKYGKRNEVYARRGIWAHSA